MSVQPENRPNESGFGGGATGPEPDPHRGPSTEENTAVPGDDLTGALSDGLDDAAHGDDPETDRP